MPLRSTFPDARPNAPVPVSWDALTDAPVGSVFGVSGEGVHGCFVLTAPGQASTKMEARPVQVQQQLTYWKHRKAVLYLCLLGSGTMPRSAQEKAAITRAIKTGSVSIPAARLVQEEQAKPVITSDDMARVLVSALERKVGRKVAPTLFPNLRNAVDLALYLWISQGVDPLRLDRLAWVQRGIRVRKLTNVTPEGKVQVFWEGEWTTLWGDAFGQSAHANALRVAVEQGIDVPTGVLSSYGIPTFTEYQARQRVIALQKRVAEALSAISADLWAREPERYEAKYLIKHPEHCVVTKTQGGEMLLGVVRYEGERRWYLGHTRVDMAGPSFLKTLPTATVRAVVRAHWGDLPVESLPSDLQPFGW